MCKEEENKWQALKGVNERKLLDISRKVDSLTSGVDDRNIGDTNLLIYAGGVVVTSRLCVPQGKNKKE